MRVFDCNTQCGLALLWKREGSINNRRPREVQARQALRVSFQPHNYISSSLSADTLQAVSRGSCSSRKASLRVLQCPSSSSYLLSASSPFWTCFALFTSRSRHGPNHHQPLLGVALAPLDHCDLTPRHHNNNKQARQTSHPWHLWEPRSAYFQRMLVGVFYGHRISSTHASCYRGHVLTAGASDKQSQCCQLAVTRAHYSQWLRKAEAVLRQRATRRSLWPASARKEAGD